MKKTYKVWIEIEEIDENEDTYKTVGESFFGGEYQSQEEAFLRTAQLEDTEPIIEPGKQKM